MAVTRVYKPAGTMNDSVDIAYTVNADFSP